MKINYQHSHYAWAHYREFLIDLIRSSGARAIIDIGGGAFPALSPAAISDLNLAYTVMDISERQLSNLPDAYTRVVGDVSATLPAKLGHFELALSTMLAEHVRDAEAFHRNVFRLLNPGGLAFHFFPTLYSIPFVLGKVIPECMHDRLLRRLQPWRYEFGIRAHFPVHYSRCHGPMGRQIAFFLGLGYHIEHYVGFFGSSYYDSVPLFRQLNKTFSNWLVRHPVPALTDYAFVVLRRPASTRVAEVATIH